MNNSTFTVLKNRQINGDTFDLLLQGDTSEVAGAGQFVNLDVKGVFLRRPISICDVTPEGLRLVYRVVGKGTAIMASYSEGDEVDLLIPLGKGFDEDKAGAFPLLIGGGVGAPPLLMLAKRLAAQGKNTRVVLGFNSSSEVILYEDFCKAVGEKNVVVTTADGSFGTKGLVTDADLRADFIYACGPLPMLKAVADKSSCGAELSLESRMGCGFGACMGCSIMTKYGGKRVCAEGPVFAKEEIIW